MITIQPLGASARDAWQPLWQRYLDFYETPLSAKETDRTDARLVAGDGMHGALARDETGRAVGLIHWLPQASTCTTTSH